MTDEPTKRETDVDVSDVERVLERYDARRRAEDAAAHEKSALKEELTNRVSIAAIALTMLMSFLGFARSERNGAATAATTESQHAKADGEADWAYYQTRRAERASYQLADETLGRESAALPEGDPRLLEAEVHHAEYAARIAAIDDGNRQIFYSIQDLGRVRLIQARAAARIERKVDRYDMGTRVLTLALVLLSVTLLANRRSLFWVALVTALAGAAIAVLGYFGR